jgi:hypothetical protein
MYVSQLSELENLNRSNRIIKEIITQNPKSVRMRKAYGLQQRNNAKTASLPVVSIQAQFLNDDSTGSRKVPLFELT